MLIHASCVSVDGKGVLLGGPSAAGKSDLALQLIDRGAALISDDQTKLEIQNDALIASCPEEIRGLIELRHMGLRRLPFSERACVCLYVDLVPVADALERLPDATFRNFLDRQIEQITLPAFAASTAAKIRAALLYPSALNT